jgi:hypothetical protein
MNGYVTPAYDFGTALQAMYPNGDILSVKLVDPNKAICVTNHGRVYFESFEDKNARVYMKVMPVRQGRVI